MTTTQAFGPWDAGLNLSSSKDLSPYLKRNELGIATNVILTSEGFVESRPGIKVLDSLINNVPNRVITILGSIQILNEYITVVQGREPGVATLIYYIRGNKEVILKATFSATEDFSSVLPLKNSDFTTTEAPNGIFLFSSVAENKCYRLELVPSITPNVTPTLMSSTLKVPKSHESYAVKDRVFLLDHDASRLNWSAILTNSLWFDDEQKDVDNNPTPRALETGYVIMDPSVDLSDNLTCSEFLNNAFYIFKKNNTYMFTFQADPESDGYLRKIDKSLGAFDSTVYRNTVVVINNKGVFSIEGTKFIDLQKDLNLRFETDLDRLTAIQAFITDANNNLLIGYRIEADNSEHHYVLNGYNKGWTQWDFSYSDDDIATPGNTGYFAETSTGVGVILYTNFQGTRLVYQDWKPSNNNLEYHLDSGTTPDQLNVDHIRYIPNVEIQTNGSVGSDPLKYKKIYRAFIRLYVSDVESTVAGNSWELSVNYNEFYFQSTNPKFILYPSPNRDQGNLRVLPKPITVKPVPMINTTLDSMVYKRTFQIPIPQHRMREFVVQIKRDYTKLVNIELNNPELVKPIQQGFYFRLSGLWIDFMDKAGI